MYSINMVIKCLSMFDYNKYLKRRKIMNIYDQKGIPGLEDERYTRGSRFRYMLKLKVRLNNFVNDSTIMTCVLMAMSRSMELFRYVLPFIVHFDDDGIASSETKLIHILSSSDNEEQAILRIDYYLRHYTVDINSCDAFGRTCLFYVRSEKVFDYLIAQGAEQNIRDHDGLRPFEYMILADNKLYQDILYTPEHVTDAFAFIMKVKGSTASRCLVNLTAYLPSEDLITLQTRYECFIFLAAVNYACTPMAAEMFMDANNIAQQLDLPQVPDHMPELLDFLDSFLASKCMRPLDANRVCFLERVAYNAFSPNGQIEEPLVSWKLSYERLLNATLNHPSECFMPHARFLTTVGSFVGTLTREKRMFYLDKLMNVSWSYTFSGQYILSWVFKCYFDFSDNIEERLYNWIQPRKELILHDLLYIGIRDNLGVQFMALCLNLGAVVNDSLIKRITQSISPYTQPLLETIVLYKIPTTLDMETFNRLRWLVGPEKVPIPSLQSFCIKYLKCNTIVIPPHVSEIIKNVS